MRQDIMIILDMSISAAEIADLLKDFGYWTLPSDTCIKVWESENSGSDEVEVECASTDFYRYDESELSAIRAIIDKPQLVYVSFRNKPLAERIVNLLEKKYVSIIDNDHGSLTFRGVQLIR
ncbi:hypothetical protein GCM10007907_37000 [Chitinimonas prasina]|uniref:DUF5615 domain-containing protein n=1 Tax=Chitinimonas prasina TaxID=1434937 RepID=A0ABQ5YIS2_9NEIS|nr:hypothetical protein [Chitinimonas prasina]GLR14910.1 hypothetical protein GCM10007907_37000 [Chitinimonas prasina]